MINIYAPINNLGYGIVANNIIKSLTELGSEINVTPIGQIQPDAYFEPYVQPAIQNLGTYDANNPSVFLFHDEYSHQGYGTPYIVLSMFETSIIKKTSKHMLNNGPAKVIITTTEDHKELLVNNGVEKPIEVVNCGVDDSIYNTLPVDKAVETGKFTFITSGKREKRKNTDEIIRSFMISCITEEAALIAHTFNPFTNRTQEHPFKNLTCWTGINPIQWGFKYEGFHKNLYHKFTKDKCDIYFTTPSIPSDRMPSLYHSANVGIQYSSAEGWDLPLIEAMACGVPCIATTCIGHREFVYGCPDIQDNLLIETTGEEIAQDDMWFKGDVGTWETVDATALRDTITDVLNNKEKYKEKNEELSTKITSRFPWRNSAEKLLSISKNYK